MPTYLTTSDVATRLGVSLDTVRRWLRSGELKGTPFGRAGYRIEDTDFQAFLRQRQRPLQKFDGASEENALLAQVTLEELMNAVGQQLHRPLTTTRGVLQQARHLLQRALEMPASDATPELLAKLQDSLMRAERQIGVEMQLVGNLLDAARIEANTFELSLIWCNLVEIVRETVISQQEFAAHRVFELELPGDEPVGVIADADRIKQALTNYLTNALKFSPAEQPIKIVLEVRDIQAQVSVQDKGPGVPDADQSRIWERFWRRQKQSARSRSGLGLGLYITRAIINQHHGQVGIESRKGQGATFWFTLPLADETWH
ncbi:MAG TPA: ATP-binding protein [Ktedonobacteraceae bacterium]|jgi:excisionase family DNA binding protein|nr:ATP-binding protein [Ktedonobacteraceae bacterium]